jgi:carbon storage regulator
MKLTGRLIMLILTRRVGESLMINDDIEIMVMEIKGNQVRVGFKAPKNHVIHRKEIYDKIQEELSNEK